jgi:dihydroorotate dehydrogenase (NAD+) catalytic subunit
VGTANFVDPFIWPKLVDGLRAYMARHGFERVSEIVGSLELPSRQDAECRAC